MNVDLGRPFTVPDAPVIPLLRRSEIIACICARAMLIVLAGAVIFGGGWLLYCRFKIDNEIARCRSVEEASRLALEKQLHLTRLASAQLAIAHSNFRLANALMLHRLFSIPRPSNNSFRLDRLEVISTPARAGTRESYRAEFAWSVMKAAPMTDLVSLTTEVFNSFRPDFGPNSTAIYTWKTESVSAGPTPVLNTPYESGPLTVSLNQSAPAEGLYVLRPGKTQGDMLSDLKKFYSR